MKIELTLPRARFVAGGTVEVTLRLHNDGVAPVRVPDPFRNDAWQPTYVLTGPAFPQGRRFSARSATARNPHAATGGPLTLVELLPGQTHAGELPLSLWCPIDVPGAYTLVAELDHEEDGGPRIAARSQPLAFELEAIATHGVSVGVDVLRGPPGDLHASLVHAGAGGAELVDALFVEDRPDLGELRRASLESRRTLAATGMGEVLVPWCNVDRMTAIAAWRAWTHGGALHADDSPLGAPVAVPLPPAASLLPPAWQDPSEVLEVLVLEADRRRMQLARFASHGPPTPPTGALVWRSDDREAIVTARLALGPAAQGSLRRIVAVETHGEDLRVSCFDARPDGSGAPLGTMVLPELDPVPGTALALRVMPDGRTKVWMLVDAKEPGWQVYLSHVIFDVTGEVLRCDRHVSLVTLAAPLLEAALELVLPEDREPEELVWALRIDDRRVLWSRGGRAARWLKTPRPTTIATPMQLRPLSQATYLATLRPGHAPELVTLEDQ